MTKPTISQSQKRFQESVGALFSKTNSVSDVSYLFLKSSTDIGVIRNGGRNGARYAPQSFLSTFRKFSQNTTISKVVFHDHEVGNEDEEKVDFHLAQKQESERISNLIGQFQNPIYAILAVAMIMSTHCFLPLQNLIQKLWSSISMLMQIRELMKSFIQELPSDNSPMNLKVIFTFFKLACTHLPILFQPYLL